MSEGRNIIEPAQWHLCDDRRVPVLDRNYNQPTSRCGNLSPADVYHGGVLKIQSLRNALKDKTLYSRLRENLGMPPLNEKGLDQTKNTSE